MLDQNKMRMDEWTIAQFAHIRHRIRQLERSHKGRSKRGLIDGVGWLVNFVNNSKIVILSFM